MYRWRVSLEEDAISDSWTAWRDEIDWADCDILVPLASVTRDWHSYERVVIQKY